VQPLTLERLHAPQGLLGLVWSRADGHRIFAALGSAGRRGDELAGRVSYCTEILAALGADVIYEAQEIEELDPANIVRRAARGA
jgi:hypothetical protein